MSFFPGLGLVLAGAAAGERAISETPTIVYKSSGTTWTVPSNYQPIGSIFDMYGGGGSGGDGSTRSSEEPGSGGGGGGGFCRVTEFVLTPGSTLYYAVGAEGAFGGNGGGTWINKSGNFVPTSSSQGGRAYGGYGGGDYSGGNGGGALYGSINRTGGSGSSGWVDSVGDFFIGYGGGGGGCAGTSSNGGNGSQSYGGSGGGGFAGNGGNEDYYGYAYGGGGGGFQNSKNQSEKAGYQGYLVITYYPYL